MALDQIEHFFACPYCFSTISILLDYSIANQEYIEDCEVCCQPIQIEIAFSGEDLTRFSARNID